ncbi:PQQ-binding-like beta-propeller repeat protein [Nocardioides psychrotolerans]|uniref:outer membrane protein assembly factor BamB family protein n=1 Tax=Nocardioides psychrotolerans TaxID=1005945 RepID=UPI0031377AD0
MGARLRRAASWVPALVVAPLAMAGAFVVSQPEESFPELTRLHPLEPGTTWVYAVSVDGQPSGTRTRSVRGDAGLIDEDGLVDAVQLTSVYTDYPGTGPSSNLVYLSVRDEAIEQLSLRQDRVDTPLDPPAPAYRLPLEEGAAFSYDGTLGETAITYEVTLERIEDIQVGGRTFTDCAYSVTELDLVFADGTPGDHETTEEWTCPGYGPVRIISTIEAQDRVVTEELVEFHGVHRDWRSAEADRVAQPSVVPLGATAALTPTRTNAVPDGALSSQLAWSDTRDQRFLFGPASDGEVMVMGDQVGDLAATEVATGAVRWRLAVPGPIVAPPVVVGDVVLVADADKNLLALSTETGDARWVHHFDDVVSAAPAALGESVLVATDDGRVSALSLADGAVAWSDLRSAPTRRPPAATADRWVVADESGAVTAYAESGEELWDASLEEGLAVGPAIGDAADEQRVLLADLGGVLYAYAVDDGALAWETTPRGFPSEALAVADGLVVAVEDAERIEAFDLEDGSTRWSGTGSRLYGAPVVVGDEVVTVSSPGQVVVRSLATGDVAERWSLPRVTPDARLDADIDPTVVGDALVLGAAVTAAETTAALYAYPFGDVPATPGVFLTTDDVRSVGATPTGPPAFDGDLAFVGGFDSVLYSVPASGTATGLHTTSVFEPAPAAGQGLVVGQLDDRFVAYATDDLAGGPLWTAPATDASPGVSPAIGEDAVFLPRYNEGLAAVELDGTPRWDITIPNAFAPTSPLPLPGGDVLYGAGGLSRLAGATGEARWTDVDAQLPGLPAYDDGLVVADVLRFGGTSGLVAYDAGTGRQRWTVEGDNPLFGGGPAIDDGVVVDVDAGGRVVAVDATDGSELWGLQLQTAPGGRPVIIDGRVFLLELGRTEDLFSRDFRLSIHDLRTGAFLGAYEPATTPFVTQPVLTATPDGRVVVPNGTDFGALLLMEPRS